MAGEALIGALRVVLGLDTAEFSKGTSKATRDLGNLQKSMATAAKGMSVAVAASAAALFAATKSASAYAASVGDAADRVGVNVEKFQELAYAAKLAGVDQEAFGKSLEQMNKRLGEVKTGNTAAAESLGKLGLNLKQVKALQPDQAFALIAQKISQVKNPMEQAALATEFFGKAGVKLLPVLAEGQAGLLKMAAEARRFGLILSADTIDQAKKADDAFDQMALAFKVAGVNLTAGMLPAIEALRDIIVSQQFQQGMKDLGASIGAIITWITNNKQSIRDFGFTLGGIVAGGKIAGGFGAIAGGLTGLGYSAVTATKSVDQLTQEIDANEKELMRWKAIAAGDLIPKTKIDEPTEAIEALEKKLKDLRTQLELLQSESQPTQVRVNKPPPAIDPSAMNAARALSEEMKDVQFRTQLANNEFRLFAEGFPEAAKKLKLFGQAGIETRTTVEQLPPGLRALNDQLLILQGVNLTKEMLTPWQQYQLEIQKINMLLQANVISAETAARANQKAAEKAGISWQQQVPAIAGSFAEIAGAFGKEGSKMAAAAKVLSAFQALVATYAGSAEALKLPFPLNLAASAAILAKGLLLVAAIKGFAAPKMATGGQFTIPGGQGGGDRKLVPIMGFPGERVTVERPDQIAQRGGGAREITIHVDEISRGTVEKLIPALNAALGDGHKLKVA